MKHKKAWLVLCVILILCLILAILDMFITDMPFVNGTWFVIIMGTIAIICNLINYFTD